MTKKKNEIEQKTTEEHLEEAESEDTKVHKLQRKLEECENKYKRALADYQNLEKRTQELRIEWIKSASKDIIIKLLPVLDSLLLAQKHVQDKGLELSVKQFLQILEQEGLKQVKTIGEEFNPTTMEGVGTVDGEENIVLEEVRTGFTLHGSIVRPAQVMVGGK